MPDLLIVQILAQWALPTLLLPALILGFLVARRRRRRTAFEAIARRLSGSVVGENASRVDFRVDGVEAALTIRDGAMSLPEWTRIRFALGTVKRWRISPRSQGRIEPLRGAVEVTSGEEAFDRHYRIEVDAGATLPAGWRRLVAVAGQIGTERRLVPGAGLDVGPAGVTVTTYRSFVGRPRDLETFVSTAIELFREIRGQGVGGGVDLGPLQIRPSGTCPVCSHEVGPEGRVCPGCTTAHHADCWEYFGGCSLYACSRSAVAVRR
jgi:hypothetical protein